LLGENGRSDVKHNEPFKHNTYSMFDFETNHETNEKKISLKICICTTCGTNPFMQSI